MEAGAANGGTLLYRVGQVEKYAQRLDDQKASKEAFDDLQEEVKGMKRALWAIAIGLPVSGITFLAGVQQLVHH